MLATVSTTARNTGTTPRTTPAAYTASRIATPMTMTRPGSVRKSAVRTPEPFICVDSPVLKHVSLVDREAHKERALQHAVPPRRTGARPCDRGDHHADLSDIDLRPGRA